MGSWRAGTLTPAFTGGVSSDFFPLLCRTLRMVTLSGKALLPEERSSSWGSLERGCVWEGDAEKLSLILWQQLPGAP